MNFKVLFTIFTTISLIGIKAHAQSISILKDINSGVATSSPSLVTEFNNLLFFSAYTPSKGHELWVSDGTESGTSLFKDIYPGSASSFPKHFHVHNNKLYFLAEDPTHGKEFWVSDGTAVGTTLLKDITPGASSNIDPEYMPYLSVGNVLYFVANDSVHGVELWRTEGTEASTWMVADIDSGVYSSYPFNLNNLNGTLIFSAQTQATGYELWKSDGTASGTEMIIELLPNMIGSTPRNSVIFNNMLYFAASTENNFGNLWMTDGTAIGTQLVSNDVQYIGQLINWNNKLYFSGDHGDYGYELWTSDGTASGTTIVKDIFPGTQSALSVDVNSYPQVLGNTLYFVANDSVHGRELWKSDGTASGTEMVYDFQSGIENGVAYSSKFAEWNGLIYLAGSDAFENFEPWSTNGFASGTAQTIEIQPGFIGSNPYFYGVFGGRLYFAADHPDYGTELFYFNDDLSTNSPEAKGLTVFPNPFKDHLTVKIPAAIDAVAFRIVLADGRIVAEMHPDVESTSLQINTQELTSGYYFVQTIVNGQLLQTFPVVKE